MHTMPTSDRHTIADLAQERLGATPLIGWLEAKYAELNSWEQTASALHARTDVYVSRETVRRWVNDARKAAAA